MSQQDSALSSEFPIYVNLPTAFLKIHMTVSIGPDDLIENDSIEEDQMSMQWARFSAHFYI